MTTGTSRPWWLIEIMGWSSLQGSRPQAPTSLIGSVARWTAGRQSLEIKLFPAFDDDGVFVLKTDSANELAEKWGDISLAMAVLVLFCTFVLGLVYWTLEPGFALCRLSTQLSTVSGGATTVRVLPRAVRPSSLILHVNSIKWSCASRRCSFKTPT